MESGLLAPTNALACEMMGPAVVPTKAENFAAADLIFSGKIVAIVDKGNANRDAGLLLERGFFSQ